MRYDDPYDLESGSKLASQAYWNALKKLRAAWRDVFNEELEAHGSRAMETFESALDTLKLKLQTDLQKRDKFLDVIDIHLGEDISGALLENFDLDDLPPNIIKSAILNILQSTGDGRHDLRSILRKALNEILSGTQIRRPRIGANRHWPRLLQYLRELQTESDWSPEGRGIKLANVNGRGPVAQKPRDPARLSIIVDSKFI